MLNRRHFVGGTLATIVMSLGETTPSSRAAEPDVIIESNMPPLPPDLQSLASIPPVETYYDTEQVGNAKPKTEEIDMAAEILFGSPFNTTPIDVARYFYNIGQEDPHTSKRAQYVREWPVRANPVIHHFFVATQTFPAGDTTKWCAASANWFIARAYSKSREEIGQSPRYFVKTGKPFTAEAIAKTSNNAQSGSFRCFPKSPQPTEGDLAVFADSGTESESCSGSGHVAFYLETVGNYVRVLGGNQSLTGTTGAITIARRKISGGSAPLFGIRLPAKA